MKRISFSGRAGDFVTGRTRGYGYSHNDLRVRGRVSGLLPSRPRTCHWPSCAPASNAAHYVKTERGRLQDRSSVNRRSLAP